MKASSVIKALEAFAPLGIQEKWDNSGLCIGSSDAEVTGIMVGFDCTADLVREAVAAGANMVVTHHPLIFGGIKGLHPGDPVSEAVVEAVRHNVLVFALHTPADKVRDGVSWQMALRLGLEDIEILAPEADGNGLGAVGNLPEPLAGPQEAVALVKNAFSLEALRCSRPVGNVRRIAMCGGSGSDLIPCAMASGAQLYISADIHYHHFFTPQDFMIMDIGHFEGEVCIVKTLSSFLSESLPSFPVFASDPQNPVFWF